MALTVGELVAYMKLDKDHFTRGLQAGKAQLSAFGNATGRVFTTLGAVIAHQARGSGEGILDLTKKLLTFGAVAGAVAVGVGGVFAALPVVFAAAGAALLAENAKVAAAWSGLGDHIKATMTKAAQPLGPVFVQVAGELRKAFDQVAPAIGQAFAAVGPMILTLTEGITGLAVNLVPALAQGMLAAAPVIGTLRDGLAVLGEGLAQFLGGLSSGAQGGAQALGAIFDMLGALLGPLGQLLGAIASVGGAFLQALLPVVTQLANTFIGALIPVVHALEPALERVADALVPVADAFGVVFDALAPVIVQLSQDLATVIEDLAPMFADIVRAVAPLAAAFVALLGPITPLVPVLAELITAFVTGLAPILAKLVPLLAQIAAMILTALGNALTRVFDAIQPLLPIIGEFVLALGDALLQVLYALEPVFYQLVDALVQMLPSLVQLLPPLAELVAALVPVIALIAQLVGWVLSKLVPILVRWQQMTADLATAIIEWLTKAINWLLANVPGAWNRVADFIGRAIDIAKGHISWFAGLPGLLGDWFGRARDAVAEKIRDLLAFVRDLPGDILNAVGDLGSLLYQAGRNVIQGLINGIKDKIADLGRVVSGAAQTVRDHWPFSPAKVGPLRDHPPDQAGRNIMRMLAAGIAAERGALGQAMNLAVSAVVPNRPLAAGPAAPETGSSRGGIHIENVHVRAYSDRFSVRQVTDDLWFAAATG